MCDDAGDEFGVGGGGALEVPSYVEVGVDEYRKRMEALKTAIIKKNLLKAVYAIRAIRRTGPYYRRDVTHVDIGGVPILHHLANYRFTDKHRKDLKELLDFYIASGYDINVKTDLYVAQKRASFGFTALLAAVEQSNVHLVEALLGCGADVNLRDSSGFSSCHWAVLVGNEKCFRTLIENGAVIQSTDEETKGEDVHPVLHTAVDEGRAGMVFYLLEEGLVDVNQEAVYRGILSENSLTRFPSRYNCLASGTRDAVSSLETTNLICTPIGRAVRMRKIPIIEMLLKYGARLTGLDELHFCIVEGDTEVACLVKAYFTDEQLATDKIGEKWALHCLHKKAFVDELRILKTLELIYEYIGAGWDINSTSFVGDIDLHGLPRQCQLDSSSMSFAECTLLHLACLYNGLQLVEGLIEEGADLNSRTNPGGKNDITPLHISLITGNLDAAMSLVADGADVNASGHLTGIVLTRLKRSQTRNRDDYFPWECFTPPELLLRQGVDRSVPVLNAMIEKGMEWHDANELHVAISGGSSILVQKVLEKVQNMVQLEQLNWVQEEPKLPESKKDKIPLMLHLVKSANGNSCQCLRDNMLNLEEAMKAFVACGYENFSGEFLFEIISSDFYNESDKLLTTALTFDSLQLNVRMDGKSVVEHVLERWDCHCMTSSGGVHFCWRRSNQACYCCRVVKLLVQHGADVSDLVIDAKFKFHFGYKEMIQMLFCAGAQVRNDFFESPICHPGYAYTQKFAGQVAELREWVEEKKSERLTLKFLARLASRKLLQKVGNRRMLHQELPRTYVDEVLCNTIPV